MKKLLMVMFVMGIWTAGYTYDPGWTPIFVPPAPPQQTPVEEIYWQAPEVVVSTGATSGKLTCVLITNPGVALNAGTTYYSVVSSCSVLSVSPFSSISVSSAPYIHAVWSVHYWNSTSSATGK